MSNNKDTMKLDEGEKQVASVLEGQAKNLFGDALPKEMNGMLKGAISVLSRVLNDWAGKQGANIGIKIASVRGLGEDSQAKYGEWGDRLARGAITMYGEVAPAYKIVKNYFTQNKEIKNSFALAMRAEGASDGFFAQGSQLEVVKHQRDVVSQVAILTGQSALMGLAKKVPSLAMNEVQMAIANVEKEYKQEKLKKDIVEYTAELEETPKESKLKRFKDLKDKLNLAEKDLKKYQTSGGKGFLDEARSNEAKNIIKVLDEERFKGWIPGYDGFSEDNDNLVSSIAALDPTPKGSFKLGDGIGRVNFLNYLKIRVGAIIDTSFPKLLTKFIPDTFLPRAKALVDKPTAGQMILNLQEFLKDNPSPVRVTIGNKSAALHDYIYEVFAQHRIDMGRPALTPSAEGKLRDACVVIAEAIVDPNRQMHAQALAFLVDGNHGIVKGPDTIQQDEILADKVQTLIEKGLSSRVRLKAGEKAFDKKNFTPEEFFESWDNLTENEKMVWSTFFSDEMLLEGGIKREEIKQYRRRGNDLVMEVMDEMFHSIEKLSAKELHEDLGLDVKTARQVAKFVEGMRRDPHNFTAERRKEAMELTAELGVKLSQDENRPEFLAKIIDRAESRKLEAGDIWADEPKKTSFRDKVRGERAPSDELEEEMPGERSFSSREKKTTSYRDRHHEYAREHAEGGRNA